MEQRDIQHGAFIEDQRVTVERLRLIAPERASGAVLRAGRLEQTVDRLRLPSGKFLQTLRGAPGRRGEHRLKALCVE